MASLVLLGDTSGSITVAAPAIAGSNTQTLPAVSGTVVVGSAAVSAAGQIPFSTNGTTYTPTAKIVSGTAVTLTNQTAPDFTGIPSWAKRITVMFNGVSTNSTGNPLIQLGDAGGYETTGYVATSTNQSGTVASYTSAFGINNASAAAVLHGSVIISLLSATTNTWAIQGSICASALGGSYYVAGAKSLSETLTSVRLFIDGTQFFDAGTINILYE